MDDLQDVGEPDVGFDDGSVHFLFLKFLEHGVFQFDVETNGGGELLEELGEGYEGSRNGCPAGVGLEAVFAEGAGVFHAFVEGGGVGGGVREGHGADAADGGGGVGGRNFGCEGIGRAGLG